MDNNLSNLPKSFFEAPTATENPVQFEVPVPAAQVEDTLLLTKKNLGFHNNDGPKESGNQFGNESGAPTAVPETEDEMSSIPDSAPTTIGKDDDSLTAGEEKKFIEDAAAAIEKQLSESGESWNNFTDEEKLIAASACPEALMAELQRQIDEAPKDEAPTEFACKASKKKQKEPSLKVQPAHGGAKSVCSESSKTDSTSSTPSIWKSGTTRAQKAPTSVYRLLAC